MNNPLNSEFAGEFSRLSVDLLNQSVVKINHCLGQLTENQVWWRPQPSMNSIGNLLIAPFTLADDSRDRESEFSPESRREVVELIQELESLVVAAKDQWRYLSESQLSKTINIQGFDVSRMQTIIHASSHFVGHTHQIIQLTRLQLASDYKFHWTPNDSRGELPI
jgi:hypothetical protein